MKKEILEVWKPVPGYEGQYEVSNLGRVKSLAREIPGPYKRAIRYRILKQSINDRGYLVVSLHKNAKVICVRVNTLVLKAFIGPKPSGYHGCHRNDIKTNNLLSNLYWGTPKENAKDAKQNGRYPKGEYNHSKLSEEQARFAIENYSFRHPEFNTVALAKRFNVHFSTIQSLLKGRSWNYLNKKD